MANDTIREIAKSCTIAKALAITGYALDPGNGRKPTQEPRLNTAYRSPLREDTNPSFSIYIGYDGTQLAKDQATGDVYNSVGLVAALLCKTNGQAAQIIDEELGLNLWHTTNSRPLNKGAKLELPSATDLDNLSEALGFGDSTGATRLCKYGILKAGSIRLNYRFWVDGVWALVDIREKAMSARRIDAQEIGRAKSVCPKGWNKKPIGISMLTDGDDIAIIEGEKDTVAVYQYLDTKDIKPVCMPSAGVNLPSTLPKQIEKALIFAQADQRGVKAALRWAAQVRDKAKSISILIPRYSGTDWADVFKGANKESAAEIMLEGDEHIEYVEAEILSISPEDYPTKTKDAEPRAAKQRGSRLNTTRDHQVELAMAGLPRNKQTSPTAICRALGWSATSTNRTKVLRSLSRLKANP